MIIIMLLSVIAVALLAVAGVLLYVRSRRKGNKEESSAFTIGMFPHAISITIHQSP